MQTFKHWATGTATTNDYLKHILGEFEKLVSITIRPYTMAVKSLYTWDEWIKKANSVHHLRGRDRRQECAALEVK